MKKRTKVIISLAVACAGTFVLGACSSDDHYTAYREQGFTYTVIFESNGGMLASNPNTQIKYLLKESDVAAGRKLVQPDDRNVLGTDFSTCYRDGYFLSGWYRVREDRKDGDKPLDDYGDVCTEVPVTEKGDDGKEKPVLDASGKQVMELRSANGKAPGYVYSDPWDFSKKITASDFNTDSDGDGENDTLLLYAGWVPQYIYRLHWTTPSGESGTEQLTFDPMADPAKMEIQAPTWGEGESVELTYGSFPKLTGKTFSALYSDEAKTQKVDVLKHSGKVNEEKGICENGIADYYVDLLDGEWYHIYRAEDFVSHSVTNGCYEIYNDLDFSNTRWAFTGSFQGEFHGNNHKISNITVVDDSTNSEYGGLFGRIMEGALFENVTFENVTYTLAKGSRRSTALFGFFAGEISSEAEFRQVKITGTYRIGCEPTGMTPFCSQTAFGYHVGLISGNGVGGDKIDHSGVKLEGVGNVEPKLNDDESITITVKE